MSEFIKCDDESMCSGCYSGQWKCENQKEAFEHMFANFNTLGSTNHKDWMEWAFDKGVEYGKA